MKKSKVFGTVWAASTLALAIGGNEWPVSILFVLAAASVVSALCALYCLEKEEQQQAQHELNERLRGTSHETR